jgi:hypothetical protein
MAPSTEHNKTLGPTPGERPHSAGHGAVPQLSSSQKSKHKAKNDSSASRNKLNRTFPPRVHRRSVSLQVRAGGGALPKQRVGWAAVWWGKEATWPVQASRDTLGLTEGPGQATEQ